MRAPITVQQRVRHYETDAQDVVFNMWYLGYCDEACADFFAAIDLDYSSLVEQGWDFQLVNAELDWTSPLRAREVVDIAVTCDRVGTTSFSLRFTMTCQGRPIAVVTIVYVGVATDGSGTLPVPSALRTRLEGHRTVDVGPA